MTIGPGKYDDEASAAMKSTNAAGVILIVVGGDKGAGFSVQATEGTVLALPSILRSIADQMEADIPALEGGREC